MRIKSTPGENLFFKVNARRGGGMICYFEFSHFLHFLPAYDRLELGRIIFKILFCFR